MIFSLEIKNIFNLRIIFLFREIVKNLKLMIDGKEPKPMIPWFKGFKGTIEEIDSQRYAISGEISTLSDTKVEITELPIRSPVIFILGGSTL